jgi:carbon-monoxide dehydrogenase medium subunit
VKPAPFDYRRADTAEQAVSLLAEYGTDAKVLAGGQSLIPLLKLRLARPRVLIDLNPVRALSYVREADGGVAFGAMARLASLDSPEVRATCPILGAAAAQIAHAAIRHRGTVCGSLAHADPAAELPVLAVVLDAELRVLGRHGVRSEAAGEFFLAPFTTRVQPSELLVEARFPALAPGTGWSFQEFSRRPGDFALAAAAAVVTLTAERTIATARIALGGVADRAVRDGEAERSLRGKAPGSAAFRDAARMATASLDPPADVHGSSAYRRQLAAVLVERALAEACDKAGRGPGLP